MAQTGDPAGFAGLREPAEAGPAPAMGDARYAATGVAPLMACKGGLVGDITVGDCGELAGIQRRVHARGGQRKADFCLRLRALCIFPAGAPATIRASGLARGQLTAGDLIDRYRLRCKPVRDPLAGRLKERQPALDYASLDSVLRSLAGLFWARIEALSPGTATLRLPPEVARAWNEDVLAIKRGVTGPAGKTTVVTRSRINARDEPIRVRALYLDIARQATGEPGRRAGWAVPGPVSDAETGPAGERRRRTARMDQRTRGRLPVLARTAADRKNAAARHLRAALATPPGEIIKDTGGTPRRAVAPTANGRHVRAEDTAAGQRRNLSHEDEEAFWALAVIEVLNLTGIGCEGLLERPRHGITGYRLAAAGELVRLPQIAPGKTDTDRLLLVSPELAGVLSAIISGLRGPGGGVPPTVCCDVRERVRNPPMPPLFQRSVGSENRAFTRSAVRTLFIGALAATGLTGAAGDPLMCSPHDFRRIFVTDAIMSGLPPHIARVICGHKAIGTTSGDKAVCPAEAIEARRGFLARRRATRPGEECRTPAGDERDALLAHLEKRKVSVGTCARAFASPGVQEHGCVGCPLGRPDPARRARLGEIRDSPHDRIAAAGRDGWLGEIEGLKVSLAGTQDKLARIDAARQRRDRAVHLGRPAFPGIAGRSVPGPEGPQ